MIWVNTFRSYCVVAEARPASAVAIFAAISSNVSTLTPVSLRVVLSEQHLLHSVADHRAPADAPGSGHLNRAARLLRGGRLSGAGWTGPAWGWLRRGPRRGARPGGEGGAAGPGGPGAPRQAPPEPPTRA